MTFDEGVRFRNMNESWEKLCGSNNKRMEIIIEVYTCFGNENIIWQKYNGIYSFISELQCKLVYYFWGV